MAIRIPYSGLTMDDLAKKRRKKVPPKEDFVIRNANLGRSPESVARRVNENRDYWKNYRNTKAKRKLLTDTADDAMKSTYRFLGLKEGTPADQMSRSTKTALTSIGRKMLDPTRVILNNEGQMAREKFKRNFDVNNMTAAQRANVALQSDKNRQGWAGLNLEGEKTQQGWERLNQGWDTNRLNWAKERNQMWENDTKILEDGTVIHKSGQPHPGEGIFNQLAGISDPAARKKYFDSLTPEQKSAVAGYRDFQQRLSGMGGGYQSGGSGAQGQGFTPRLVNGVWTDSPRARGGMTLSEYLATRRTPATTPQAKPATQKTTKGAKGTAKENVPKKKPVKKKKPVSLVDKYYESARAISPSGKSFMDTFTGRPPRYNPTTGKFE